MACGVLVEKRIVEHAAPLSDAAVAVDERKFSETSRARVDREMVTEGVGAANGLCFDDTPAHPAVRLNYDTANSVLFGDADVPTGIPAALPWLGHVHLKDKFGGRV